MEDLIRELEPPPPEPPPPVAPAPPPAPALAPAAPAPTPPAAETRSWTSDTLGLVLTGGGLVAAGVGVGLIVHSGSVASEAEATRDESQALTRNDSARALRVAGLVLTGAGVALTAAGVIKLATFRAGDGQGVAATVGVAPGWLVVRGRF